MKYVAVTALLAVSALASFYYYNHKSNSVTLNSYGTVVNTEADDQWKAIQALLDKKPETIADFLGLLKEKGLVSFHNYSLVHNTRSMQKSSLLYPRVILSGRNLFLAFNGDKDLDGHGALEVITYDEKIEAFKFREVLFVKEASKKDFEKITEEEIEEKTATHWISKTNPSICMDCHSIHYSFDPRPLWDSYFHWPGVYGAVDDELEVMRRGIPSPIPEKESVNFKKFQLLVENEKPARYSQLTPVIVRFRKGQQAGEGDRPNTRLTKNISYLMGRRAARQMARDAETLRFRYAVLALYTCFDGTRNAKDITASLFPNHPDLLNPPDSVTVGKQLSNLNIKYEADKLAKILTEDFQIPTQLQEEIKIYRSEPEGWCRSANCEARLPKLSIYLLLRKLNLNLVDWEPVLDELVPLSYVDSEIYFIHGYADVLMEQMRASPDIVKMLKPFGYFNFSNRIEESAREKMCSNLSMLSREALR